MALCLNHFKGDLDGIINASDMSDLNVTGNYSFILKRS